MAKNTTECNTAIYFRLSTDELNEINEKAKMLHMTRSQFIRQATKREKIYILAKDEIKQLTSELRKIGINVNQIAILCNMGKLQCVHIEDTKNEITKVWEELKKLRQEVKKLNQEN